MTLVADIGGTNTRVALAGGAVVDQASIRRFRNAEHDGLRSVLMRYLEQGGQPPLGGVCVAMAGPVRDGVGDLTNLNWRIEATMLADVAQSDNVAVLNDLQAQGHALDSLSPDALRILVPGQPAAPQAARLVVGIGTGFNIAPVYSTPAGLLVEAAEAGHVALPVADAEGLALAEHVKGEDGFAAVEDVLSGRGFTALQEFVAAREGSDERTDGAAVTQALESGGLETADATAQLFVRCLGGVVGNLALTLLPFGGIYLCGGVARAIAPHLQRLGFEAALHDKGRFSDYLGSFPVRLIEDDYAALTGCAAFMSARRAV